MDQLALRFHSLGGSTLQEKRRSFNFFLKSLESGAIDTSELTDFISSIKPTNPTEELFRIEILLQFKQYDLLRDELKRNSPLLVRKLLKNWKLFGDLFSSIDADTLVTRILPYVSHSMKYKLLNGICKNVKNEILLDEYFLVLENKYGLKTALILLSGCTMDLIKTNMTKHYIRLTNRQLIAILKKDKHFLEYYFDVLRKKDTNFDLDRNYGESLKFISKIDASLYWRLSEKYNFHIIFGKYMTAKMLEANNKVLTDVIKYIHDFNLRQLYKAIRKDGNIKLFLLNAYPETIESISYYNFTINCFIKFLPKHELYSVIMSICKEKYGKNLLDYPECWYEDFIKFIPTKERENILNILVKKDEQLVYLYETSKSIPIIKKRLHHCSDANVRAELIVLMYNTCVVNEDKVALLEALHFVLNRHKNDIKVITKFFSDVMRWPNVITLNEKYWKYIVGMAKIIEIVKEHWFLYNYDFYTKYICHLLEHNIPCQEQCKEFIKHICKYADGIFSVVDVDKKYERLFIEQMGVCIATFKESEHYQHLCVNFLSNLAEYNNRNTTDQIPYNNYNHFFDQIKSNDCYESEVAIQFGLKTYQTEFWHALYWNITKIKCLNYGILLWYFKHYPKRFVQNFEKIRHSSTSTTMEKICKQARKVLDEDDINIIEMYALNNLHNKDQHKIQDSLNIVSILKPKSLSERILPLLIEPDVEMNLKKSENKSLHKILIKNLQKFGNPLDIFSLIPRCCTKYHFKYALTPLQSVAYHTPEQHVKHNLMQYFAKAQSIRKQILILAKELLVHDAYVKLLEEFCDIETSVSIKNIIFMKTLQYFIENPSDSLWILTQKNMNLLDKDDRGVFNALVDLEKIPQEYLSRYIAFTFVQISNNVDLKIKEKRFQLLNSVPSQIIDDFSTEFLMHIIVDTACRVETSNFHWNCVFNTSGLKQEQLFKKNFEVLKIYVEKTRSSSSKDPIIRAVIKNFFKRFLDIATEMKQGGNLIEKFIPSWTSILQPNSFCKEYITLLFTDLYFKSNFEAIQTGIRINEFLLNYIDKHSPSIIPIVSRHLKEFLNTISIHTPEQIMNFIEGFVNKEINENIYLVLIHILPEISKIDSIDCFRNHPSIKEIQECITPVVKFHYNMNITKN